MSQPMPMFPPRTIGELRIEAFLKEHGGHWLFIGTSIGGPYIGCNNCCRCTTPADWPELANPASGSGHDGRVE